jgi:hypothetical protein
LLNEYSDGQGIDKHNDGELYNPFVVVLSLQSSALVEFEVSPSLEDEDGKNPDRPLPLPLPSEELSIFPEAKEPQEGVAETLATLAAPVLTEAEPLAPKVLSPLKTESLLLRPRSVLVFSHDAYISCKHTIKSDHMDKIEASCVNRVAAGVQLGQKVQRGQTRLSLTLRQVAKVLDNKDDYTVAGSEEKARKEKWFLGSISERNK